MKQFLVAFTLIAIVASIFPYNITAQTSPYDKVFCYRESAREGNSVKVQILVNLKGLSKGKIVKLKEKIPAGFKGQVIDGYGSAAEATETSVNFVWNKLPEADVFLIKYELIYPGPVNEVVNISGNMSYMSDFGIKYISVVERAFSTENDFMFAIRNIPPYKQANVSEEEVEVVPVNKTTQQQVVVNTGTDIPKDAPKPKPRTDVTETKTEVTPVNTQTEVKPQTVTETKTEVTPVNTQTEVKPQTVTETKTEVTPVNTQTEVKPQTVTETKTEVKPVVEEKPVVNNSGGSIASSTGVFYSVQVGASADKLAPGYFDKYSFDRPVEENPETGMYKYLLGRFPTLKEANAYFAKVKAKGVACFVVAYKDGKRCTVKEALEVSGK